MIRWYQYALQIWSFFKINKDKNIKADKISTKTAETSVVWFFWLRPSEDCELSLEQRGLLYDNLFWMRESEELTVNLQISPMFYLGVVLFEIKKERSTPLMNSMGESPECLLHTYRYTSWETDKLYFSICRALRLGSGFEHIFWVFPDIFGPSHETINVKA